MNDATNTTIDASRCFCDTSTPCISIPPDQRYYWTPEWQAGVREAREAYERGDWEEWSL